MSDPTATPTEIPASAAPDGPQPLRASDADRHSTVHQLQDAVARGLLTTDEGSQRMAAAYAARLVRDLPLLTADLPPAPTPAPAAVVPGWRPLAAQAWTQTRASVTALTAGGWRSPRVLVMLTAVLVALLAVVLLGVGGVDLLLGDPHAHAGFVQHH